MWNKEGTLKKLLMASLAVGMLAVSAPLSAHAASFDYRGGCGFDTLNDTTPGGQLGGQDVWNGGVYLVVVPTDTAGTPTGAAADVTCELKVNGVSQGTVLSASGTGIIAAAGQIQFTAAITDIVSLCDHVTVGAETIVNCGDATTTQIIPQPVIDALILVLDTAVGAANTVIDLLNSTVFSQLDPTICAGLIAIAPVVNTLPSDIAHIDPATGDTGLGKALLVLLTGDPDVNDGFWDCPPYEV